MVCWFYFTLTLATIIKLTQGTAVGSEVFLQNGWRAAAGLSLGWIGWQLFILLSRGPHCQRKTWIGWEGGALMSKSKPEVMSNAIGIPRTLEARLEKVEANEKQSNVQASIGEDDTLQDMDNVTMK